MMLPIFKTFRTTMISNFSSNPQFLCISWLKSGHKCFGCLFPPSGQPAHRKHLSSTQIQLARLTLQNLGVTVDKHLKWTSHNSTGAINLRRLLFQMKKIRYFTVTKSTVSQLVYKYFSALLFFPDMLSCLLKDDCGLRFQI